MITKPTIIVTSLGRTGTLYFARIFKDLYPDMTSLHEPDILTTNEFHNFKSGIIDLRRQLNEAGVGNKVIRKALGSWGLATISDARVRNEMGFDAAVEKVLKQRSGFIQNKPGSVYAESSAAFYGLIDVSLNVFTDHRIVYVIRDGREWIKSKLNYNTSASMYSKSKIREFFSHHWPNAVSVRDERYSDKWKNMDNIEKLSWGWAYLNKYALTCISKNPNAKLYLFEDLFQSPDRYEHLKEMLEFIGGVSSTLSYDPQKLTGILDRQIHASRKSGNTWESWSPQHKDQFIEMCGPTMESLGYKI